MNGDQFLVDNELEDAVSVDVGEDVTELRRNRKTLEELMEEIVRERTKGVGKIKPADGESGFLEFSLFNGRFQQHGMFLDSMDPGRKPFCFSDSQSLSDATEVRREAMELEKSL
jgi:hypothetical protein